VEADVVDLLRPDIGKTQLSEFAPQRLKDRDDWS